MLEALAEASGTDRAVQLLDLSHRIEHGMVTYPGLPGPVIGDHLSYEASRDHYAAGTEFHIGRIEMVANTGTYLDTPRHRFRDGWGLEDLPLEQVVDVPAVVVDAPGPVIEADLLDGLDLSGRAVLLRTGWSRHWGTDAYGGGGHPHLSADAAAALVAAGAALVGIDSLNLDDTTGDERPAHSALLAAGIPIVEHLTRLSDLPDGVAIRVTALPPAVVGLGTFPVRVIASWA
ncbi:MAG: cyclase family protein [Acidimicrobiia bacterium]